jgi:hypothetical protein
MEGGIGGGELRMDTSYTAGMQGVPVVAFTTLYYGPVLELGISGSVALGIFGPANASPSMVPIDSNFMIPPCS